jgi:hypothetical protein
VAIDVTRRLDPATDAALDAAAREVRARLAGN